MNGQRPSADDHERISRRNIGPPGTQREQHAVLIVEMNPVLAPVLTVRYEFEVPARQRVKPMRHAHTSVPDIRIRCC